MEDPSHFSRRGHLLAEKSAMRFSLARFYFTLILNFSVTILFTRGLLPAAPRSLVSKSKFVSIILSTRAMTKVASENAVDPLHRFGLPQPLLLGSASFTRKLILKEMGVKFHKVVRPIDEKSLGDRSKDKPSDLVLTLAKAKMQHLVNEILAGRCAEDMPSNESDEWIVLTGDQVVTCGGDVLEKPENVQEAKEFVSRYAKTPPATVGSCVITHLPSGIQVSGVDTATIYFKPTVPADLIDNLLKDDAPVLSCAGGLMIEHPLVREHVERIDGTEDSVMGLSKDLVFRLLEELSEVLKQQSDKQ